MSTLNFDNNLPKLLKQAAEAVLNTKLTIGEKFHSSDSYAYLLTSKSAKYVGKIFRFQHWPPPGKLTLIHDLLKTHHILHEEIIHSSYDHPIFIHGWQLSKYIEGSTVRNLRDRSNWNKTDYLTKLGQLLKQIHTIQFDHFGSLNEESDKFTSFQQLTKFELNQQDFSSLPSNYSWAKKTIDQAKQHALENLNNFDWKRSTLVHDDANDSNVIWQTNQPVLIDWVDSLAAPPLRDLATLTFRQDESVLSAIEAGYGQPVDPDELRLHQILRFIRLGHFYYFEDDDKPEMQLMMTRLKNLLQTTKPYGS